jgi:hypothetical protein
MTEVNFPSEPIKMHTEPFDYSAFEGIKQPQLVVVDEYELAIGICRNVNGEGVKRAEVHSGGIWCECKLKALAYADYGRDEFVDWDISVTQLSFSIGEGAKEVKFRCDVKALERHLRSNYEW